MCNIESYIYRENSLGKTCSKTCCIYYCKAVRLAVFIAERDALFIAVRICI